MRGDPEIRPVTDEEFGSVLRVDEAAFGTEHSEEDAKAWLSSFAFERSLAAFDEGRMVAVSTVLPLEITVPGGAVVPMGGVTWVSTLPTHRRRGLLTRLLTAQFAGMVARGEYLSGLGASEGIIYSRFGYGVATSVTSFSVQKAHSSFAWQTLPPAEGRLVLLQEDEAAAKIPALHDTLRQRLPGAVSRTAGLWRTHLADPTSERDGASRMLHVLHENGAGEPDGYASYRVKQSWEGATTHSEARVVELLAADTQCYTALWRYLLDTDLVETVATSRGRVDEPLRWLLADPRRFVLHGLFDFLWLRLLDVPRALAARRYSTPGVLVLEISHPFPTPAVQNYRLDVAGDAATAPSPGTPSQPGPRLAAECAPTENGADLRMDVGTLGAAYLGGVSFSTLVAAGRVHQLTPGAIARADAMFRTDTAPFTSTDF